jgi:hypothetical protein
MSDSATQAASEPLPRERRRRPAREACWICHSRKGMTLQGFCRCTGSLGNAHQSCMQVLVDAQPPHQCACSTCGERFTILLVSSSGGAPPPLPATLFAQVRFLVVHFIAPELAACAAAVAEFALHWLLVPVFIGAALITARGNFSLSCFDAWVLGGALLVATRRIRGYRRDVDALIASCTAAPAAGTSAATGAAPAFEPVLLRDPSGVSADLGEGILAELAHAETQPSAPRERQRWRHVGRRRLAPGTAAASSDDDGAGGPATASGTDDEDSATESSDDAIARTGAYSATRAEARWHDAAPAAVAEAAAAEAADAAAPPQVPPGEANGAATLDRQVRVFSTALRTLARYPHEAGGDALLGLLTHDLPVLLVCAVALGISPLTVIAVGALIVLASTLHHRVPRVVDPRARYAEVTALLARPGAFTSSDRDRIHVIVGVDVVLLNIMLPLMCGVIGREAVNAPTPVHGVARALARAATIFDCPTMTVWHWLVGYLSATVLSWLEAQFVTPVIASGVRLVWVRSLRITEELCSLRFMLVQIVDLSAADALGHCACLYATHLSWLLIAPWLISASARMVIAAGAAAMQCVEVAVRSAVVTAAATTTSDGDVLALAGLWAAAAEAGAAHWGAALSAELTSMTQDFEPSAAPLRFCATMALLTTALAAFYLLPHQFMALSRLFPAGRAAAARLGLTAFLFDESQVAVVEQFLELSATVPVRSDSVIELAPPVLPVEIACVRRERVVDPAAMPPQLQLRVAVFSAYMFARAFTEWFVCVVAPCLTFGVVRFLIDRHRVLGPVNGVEVMAIALSLGMRTFTQELATCAGAVAVTPLAIVFFIAELLRPVWRGLPFTLRSVWRAAYGVRRFVVPVSLRRFAEPRSDGDGRPNFAVE